jgi:hypothetical protein
MKHHARAGIAEPHQRLAKTQAVEKLERARLDRQGTRLVRPVEQAIDNPELRFEAAQLGRQRKPRRARTHD